ESPHGRRNVVLVGSGADEAQRPAVHPGALAHEPPDFYLVQLGGNTAEGASAQRFGDLLEQLLDAGGADRGQHLLDILARVGDESHHSPSVARKLRYSAADSRVATSAALAGRIRINHPDP